MPSTKVLEKSEKQINSIFDDMAIKVMEITKLTANLSVSPMTLKSGIASGISETITQKDLTLNFYVRFFAFIYPKLMKILVGTLLGMLFVIPIIQIVVSLTSGATIKSVFGFEVFGPYAKYQLVIPLVVISVVSGLAFVRALVDIDHWHYLRFEKFTNVLKSPQIWMSSALFLAFLISGVFYFFSGEYYVGITYPFALGGLAVLSYNRRIINSSRTNKNGHETFYYELDLEEDSNGRSFREKIYHELDRNNPSGAKQLLKALCSESEEDKLVCKFQLSMMERNHYEIVNMLDKSDSSAGKRLTLVQRSSLLTYLYSRALYKVQKYDEAVEVLQERQKEDSENPYLFLNLALCYAAKTTISRKNKELVAENLTKALEYDEKTLELSQKVLDKECTLALAYKALHLTMKANNNSDELFQASRCISRAIELSKERYANGEIPKFVFRYEDVVYNEILSYVLYKQDYYEPAMNHINACIKSDPEHGWAYFRLGLILHEMQEYNKALINYLKALVLAKKNAEGPLLKLCISQIGKVLKSQKEYKLVA